MSKGTLLVAGASGDVGAGITRAAVSSGWTVIAAGRDKRKLDGLCEQLPAQSVYAVPGDLSDEQGALAIWDSASDRFGAIDAAIVSVNAPTRQIPLVDWSPGELSSLLHANLLTHFAAAKAWLPRLPKTGTFLGIGGGTADFILPNLAHLSMAQSALRMMYRGLAKEQVNGARICELLLVAMINGASKRQQAKPEWLTDDEVGRHVCAILEHPALFPGPVLHLRNREAVGSPDPRDSERTAS